MYSYNIYKIRSKIGDCRYIGSTILDINTRFSVHKAEYKRYQRGLSSYISSFEVVKYPDATVKLVDTVEGSKAECLDKERFYQEKYLTVNKNKAGGLLNNPNYFKDYYQANADKLKARSKEYYEKNKTIIQCPCGGKYINFNRAQHSMSKQHQNYMINNIKVI